jgi:hypothetical protein
MKRTLARVWLVLLFSSLATFSVWQVGIIEFLKGVGFIIAFLGVLILTVFSCIEAW